MHLWQYIKELTKQQVISHTWPFPLVFLKTLFEHAKKKENGGKETVRNMVCGVVNTDKIR